MANEESKQAGKTDSNASKVPVGLGATREELRRFLGEPTDTSLRTGRQRQCMIWKYGDIEYHFGDEGRVWLVYSEDAEGNPRILAQLQE